MVDAEPAQRRVERREQVATGGVETARGAGARHGLRRHRDAVATDLVEQRSQDLLGHPVGIDVGGVDEGAADLEEGEQLVARLVPVGVAAPGHRAERQARYVQAGPAERTLFHVARPYPGRRRIDG